MGENYGITWGSMGVVVDKCSLPTSVTPGSIPVLTVSCGLSLLLVLTLVRGFFSGYSGFLPSTKTNTNSIWTLIRATSLLASWLLLATLSK